MDKRVFIKGVAALAATPAIGHDESNAAGLPTGKPDWSLNMDVLETCTCQVFCQCFFTDIPDVADDLGPPQGTSAQRYCQFNQAYRVNSGHVDAVSLDGVRFWFAGDGGDDFDKPKSEWAVLTFDSAVSRPQRDALRRILNRLAWYRPGSWKSYSIGEDVPIEWAADARTAHATLGRGSVAEIALRTKIGMHGQPVKISNLSYFGFPRHSDFILMPSTMLAYHRGVHSFEHKDKGTNGFLTTVDMTAADFAA